MQFSPPGEWDQTGCFVYELLSDVDVHDFPTIDDVNRIAGYSFRKGDMVSVDMILHSRHEDGDSNGPFLRLSDYSGWVFEKINSQQVMKKLQVQTGLFKFYVDNYPNGTPLRTHPIDRPETIDDPEIVYLPMQKIFCDRKVISDGKTVWYRVQGTNGWVFDQRGDDQIMLISEQKVRAGLFAFHLVGKDAYALRNDATASPEARTKYGYKKGDIIICDFVRESIWENGNGPFVHLANGAGWLFKYIKYEQILEELAIESGRWLFAVANETGVWTAQSPINAKKQNIPNRSTKHIVYKENEKIECDRRIEFPKGTRFYRVAGTDGWVVDKREGKKMLIMLEEEAATSIDSKGWTVEFLRGMASMVDGLEEDYNYPQNKVIGFKSKIHSMRINVQYNQTKSVTVAFDSATEGELYSSQRNCTDTCLAKIFRDPRAMRKTKNIAQLESLGDEEEALRRKYLNRSIELEKFRQDHFGLLQEIKQYDKKRAQERQIMEEKRLEYHPESKVVPSAGTSVLGNSVRSLNASFAFDVSFASPQKCSICDFVADDLDKHCRASLHKHFACNGCNKKFSSKQALKDHKSDMQHFTEQEQLERSFTDLFGKKL